MLSIYEMYNLFKQAEKEGIVTDICDYADCTQECDNCPANPACKQLGEAHGGLSNYSLFKKNFDLCIRPIATNDCITTA